MKKIFVPNIGTTDAVEVIEILVKSGDQINKDASLIVLESDKASMEIPSPFTGQITSLFLKEGDKVKEGTLIAEIHINENEKAKEQETKKEEAKHTEPPKVSELSDQKQIYAHASSKTSASIAIETENEPVKAEVTKVEITKEKPAEHSSPIDQQNDKVKPIHAGPAVRKLAREFGIDLQQVFASGPKSRILKEDLQDFVKKQLNKPVQAAHFMQEASEAIDFSQFGPIETVAMSKIQKLTAENMLRSWFTAPQVTQFETADITELENFRQQQKDEVLKQGIRLTILPFIIKTVCYALKKHPEFNVSLQNSNFIKKKYIHIGIAVDTPYGLMVPVIHNADQKGILELAAELQDLTTKAKEKKLLPNQMQGGCFSISSLGNLGGTQFTPLVNTPEVGILGLSKAQIQPVYFGEKLKPRLILPLALSYDHRAVNGAGALRFIHAIKHGLEEIKHLLM